MGIKAGIWLRVSTAGQDEASQRPDLLAYCESRGYEVAAEYVVHGESAFHGEQDPYWSRAVADIESGVIQTVVIWKVDRLDRRNMLVAIPMVNRALDAGGSVEFATQTFIDLTTMQGRIAFAMFCEMAHQESQIKSDRIKAKLPEFRANGALWGRPPWGYVVTGGRYAKGIEPTDECREIAPIMFAMIRDGSSLREVAEWLDAQGVRPRGVQAKDGDGRKLRTLDGEPVIAYGRWHEGSVRQTIGNMTYAGRRLDGQRSDKDRKTWLRCELCLWADDDDAEV
jgi:site-specific DNA recombinase